MTTTFKKVLTQNSELCGQGTPDPTNSIEWDRPTEVGAPITRGKVALFIPNFRIGGTEGQVLELAKRLDKSKYEVVVVALHKDGGLEDSFRSVPDLRLVTLGGKTPLGVLFRLIGVIREFRIQVLHSFLIATNVYSLCAGLLLPQLKVVVGLRDSLLDPSFGYGSRIYRMQARMLGSCLRSLRRFGDLYISNSEAGRGFYEATLRVPISDISNGIDTERFKPNETARGLLLDIVSAPTGAKSVGIVANCSAYKDYPNFIQAAKIIIENRRDTRFISIGEDRTDVGMAMKRLVRELGLEGVFHFLGTRSDVERLLPGLDVLCSSSITEGFPNAVAEAMACGVPCVVTDVGDSRRILGDTGIVVPPRDPEALAAGVVALLGMDTPERLSLRSAARQRVVDSFGISQMVMHHERHYEGLLSKKSHLLGAFEDSD